MNMSQVMLSNCRYFNAPILSESIDLLAFWKANASNYPILSSMAKDYLTVQALGLGF